MNIEAHYHLLTDSLPHIVWTCRPDGSCDYFNAYVEEYTGIPVAQCLDWGWKAIIHPDDLEATVDRWMRSVRTGERYEAEFRLLTAGGAYRWNLERGQAIKDERGEITAWFGTATDIDTQKRAEEKQRFLARLSLETRALTDPDEVMARSIRLLGEHMRAARTTYNEVDEARDRVTTYRDFCREGESITGTFPLSVLGPALLDELRAGRACAIHDASSDPRTSAEFETMYKEIGVLSFIAAPLLKDGSLVTILSVNMTAPRIWTEEEVELVEEVADRTWFAVENARLNEAARREIQERNRADEFYSRLAAIIESSQDAIVSKDLNGIVTSWNAAAERIYGYRADEIIGRSKAILLPPDRLDELDNILERVRNGERIAPYDTVRRRKDGSLVEIFVTVSPVRDARGKVIGASTIARDISDRIKADAERARLTEEVASHRKRLDDLIGSVPGVVWEAWGQPDAGNQRIDYVSDHVVHMLGYTTEEWVTTPNFWLSIVHPEDREQASRTATEAWERGGQHYNQFRWLRKDGEAIWCESHSVVIQDAQGAPVGMRGVTIDISERKRAEAERARHQAEIETLNEQLQRAMAETHHRVRNNLQIIAALVDMESSATAAAPEFQRIAGHVRALAAVHDLLTEQAKQDSTVTDISARQVLLKLVELVRKTAGGHRIIADIEDTRLSARQGTSLAVVAHELMTNALKYGRDVIEVRFLVRDQRATLEVADNGPGFDDSFDPEASGNTGLELISHVARWDLRARELRFDTRPQGGACVTITMPLEGLDKVGESRS